MSRKTVGALIGLAGAQVVAIALFFLFAEKCACIAGICTGADCLWGKTFGEYWSTYGLGASVCAAVIGYLVAES